MTKDFRKVFAMKAEREKRIKKICPDIPDSSGMYFTGLMKLESGELIADRQ